MTSGAIPDALFTRFMASVQAQTSSVEVKVAMIYEFDGFFNAHQAAMLLYNFASPVDKLRAMQMLSTKLVRMTCSEARDIIGATNIPADKIKFLESIKRYLIDMHSREGEELIRSCYVFDSDKYSAMNVLRTEYTNGRGVPTDVKDMYEVRDDEYDRIPAGGHQGYAALGHLYTQSCPLNQHVYGSVNEQSFKQPFKGRITVPTLAKKPSIPSSYTGHPSYAYPQGRTYAEDRQFPGNQTFVKTSMDMMLPSDKQQGI